MCKTDDQLNPKQKQTFHVWQSIDNGNTLYTLGSEGGLIFFDEEHAHGARITLEKMTEIAPFALTLGVYGVLFTTNFFQDEDDCQRAKELAKKQIEALFDLLETHEDLRDEQWKAAYNNLVDEIAY